MTSPFTSWKSDRESIFATDYRFTGLKNGKTRSQMRTEQVKKTEDVTGTNPGHIKGLGKKARRA